MRRRRLLAVGLLAVTPIVIAAGVMVGATTSYTEISLAYMGRTGDPAPPPWSRPCWRRGRRHSSPYVLPCGRVRGVVLYRESRDPDGDGDVHGVVAAGPRIVIVKTRSGPGAAPLPGVGRRVDVGGPVLDGRWGLTVIDARRRQGR